MAADHPARRTKRQKIFEPFVINGPKGERRAHLLDISETGALIHCDPSCDTGAHVRLTIRGQALKGKVAWSKSPRFGVSFAEPLTDEAVKILL